jgi:Spy/CpxP family protein refolding chaperone
MKLRTLMIPVVLAFLSVSSAHAQGSSQGNGSPDERRIQMMFKDITLTPAQKTKVDSVVAHYKSEMGPMTPGAQPDSAAMARRRSLMQKRTTDIRALLTKEQLPAFDKNVEEMRAQRRPAGQ